MSVLIVVNLGTSTKLVRKKKVMKKKLVMFVISWDILQSFVLLPRAKMATLKCHETPVILIMVQLFRLTPQTSITLIMLNHLYLPQQIPTVVPHLQHLFLEKIVIIVVKWAMFQKSVPQVQVVTSAANMDMY
jgi:hypothetical protein